MDEERGATGTDGRKAKKSRQSGRGRREVKREREMEQRGPRATQEHQGWPELPWPAGCGHSPRSDPIFSQLPAHTLYSPSCPPPHPAQPSLPPSVPQSGQVGQGKLRTSLTHACWGHLFPSAWFCSSLFSSVASRNGRGRVRPRPREGWPETWRGRHTVTERDTQRRTEIGETHRQGDGRRRDQNPNPSPHGHTENRMPRDSKTGTWGETQVVMEWRWASPSSAAPRLPEPSFILHHPSSLRPLSRMRSFKEEGDMSSLKNRRPPPTLPFSY